MNRMLPLAVVGAVLAAPLWSWSQLTDKLLSESLHIDYRTVAAPEVGEVMRAEILYQGAAAGVLRLMYREYTNELARPAFAQELTYDLAGAMPLEVAVQDARLEVLAAGNDGIRYRILKGLGPLRRP